jgi:cytochrome c oxidase subunit 4
MSSHTETTHAHGGPAVYTRNLVALLILTTITVGAAYVDFGNGNIVIALSIATIKAILVALFFMHLRWEKSVNAIICVAGFLFLGIFLMFDLLDFTTRRDPTPRNLPAMAQPTPVPPTMNPLTTPPPKPEFGAPKAAEGEHEGAAKEH